MSEVVASDHPDFIGGIVWSPCELRWINAKLQAAEARVAELERVLALAAYQLDKAAYIISYMDSFQAGECWRYARQCSALADEAKQT